MKGIKGKVAFITGGNSGIGKTTALAFAREGAKVALAARRESLGNEVVEEIKKLGGEAIFIKTDVQKPEQIEAAVSKTVETFGSLDFGFNNAGILNPLGTIDKLSLEDWNDSVKTNLTGVWLSMKYEIRQMVKQGSGIIVNNSSTHGLISTPFGVSPYDATKHGVIGITKSCAMENAKRGIRANVICPGEINTPMMDVIDKTNIDPARILARQPMGRGGEPEEVAEMVIFLCSDGASFMNGSTIVIDGGLTAT
ncbi:MAG: SDR family oxidoreductase [Prolixibacteraceae bacterium]|nr:SDR family oxidoreductase [Prolixibacteraceae bacterium]MBT6004430.1 SDR family oxidoreductase [Prolixibacteraceae bacterium]MBT6765335.1 SDR family oxidoreductase [Prolixibacteraceae bacterium]MBT6997529.1 SDR family oxidoreductase [Prolixibacteraceae bacterium]MBT7394577.1 SDR family oxidoreductase [Prolixibacteraceae bacterium]